MIRALELTDLPAVVDACQWLFAAPASVPELWDADLCGTRLARQLDDPRAACFVAEAEGRLVGFVTVYLDLVSIRLGQRAWLNELAVDPSHRSQGVGGRLLDRALAWATDSGATHLAVDSSTVRVDAHRFYRRASPSWEALCFGWQLACP